LSDFQLLIPGPGGRKARPFDTLFNLLGRGEVYPRPQRTDPCSNLIIGIVLFINFVLNFQSKFLTYTLYHIKQIASNIPVKISSDSFLWVAILL